MGGTEGQISAEMIIVLAILLAVVFLVAQQLTRLGERTGAEVNRTAEKTFRILRNITERCQTDTDCLPGQTCVDGVCT